MRETAQEKLLRMTQYEKSLWQKGYLAAGIDEVGRGPLAGPVAAACVAIDEDSCILGADDSKKLSARKREELYECILVRAQYVKCVFVSVEEIEEINILQATRRAMTQAAQDAQGCAFLVDAVTGLSLPGPSQSMTKGDATCHAIALASIVAKVERDRYMEQLDSLYPQYGFARHKGYGTPEHMAAIRRYGLCPAHRPSFCTRISLSYE